MSKGGIHSRASGAASDALEWDRKLSVTSQNSIQILTSKDHDIARKEKGLETAEEAVKADYPMLDIGRNRLRYSTIILWALPFFGWYACKYSKNSFMRLFYVDDYPKASLGIIALFSVLATIIDAFTDPAMGNVTDNFRPHWLNQLLYGSAPQTRWIGRRAPFVLAGGILAWISMFFGFWPVVPAGVAASIWYGIFHVGFKLSDTMLLIAQNAWALDMSPSTRDRSKLWASREFMNTIGIVIGTVLPGRLKNLGGLDCFEDPSDGCVGLPLSGALFGGLLFASIVLWLCTAKERPVERLPPPPPAATWSSEGIVPMLITACINRPFMFLLASEVTEAFGENMPLSILPFYSRIVIGAKCMDPVDATINAITIFLAMRLLSLPFWKKLADCVGPYYALLTHNIMVGFSHVPFIIPGRDDGTCLQVYICYAACAGWGFAYGGNYLIRVVAGECVDYDTFVTGRSREAQYPMVLGFVPKFWEAFAEGVPLLLLAYFGYVRKTADNEDPEQPWAVAAVTTACVSVVPAVFLLGGAVMLCGFPKAAREKSAHKALQNAIKNRHALGKEAVDPWCPTRVLAPPPVMGPHQGVLSFFFPFELRRAALLPRTDEVASVPLYSALMIAPVASICVGVILAIPSIYFFIQGINDLGDDLGASVSVPALIVLGFALLLGWFGGVRMNAAKEVKRRAVPAEDIVKQYNCMCRFTMQAPLKLLETASAAPAETCYGAGAGAAGDVTAAAENARKENDWEAEVADEVTKGLHT